MIRIIGWTGVVGLCVGALVPACSGNDSGNTSPSTSSGGASDNGGASSLGGASTGGQGGSTSSGGGSGGSGGGGIGGSSTTSSGFSSGLPPSETLGSLGAADTTKLCQAIAAYGATALANPKELACKLSGIGVAAAANASGSASTDAAVQKACSDFVPLCEQTPAQDAGSSCQIPSGPCSATVAELEACITDETKATKDAVAKVPDCANLTVQDLKPSDGGGLFGTSTARPASCDALEAKCPGWSFVGSQASAP